VRASCVGHFADDYEAGVNPDSRFQGSYCRDQFKRRANRALGISSCASG
jgi:hypothetical protein